MACFVVVLLASNVGAAQKTKGAKPSASASQTGEWHGPEVRFS